MTSSALNPASPMVVDTMELGRSAGATMQVAREVGAPEALGLDVFKVPESSPLSIDLTLTAVSEGVLANGEVEASAEGECARCLAPIEDTLRVQVQELYAYEGSATEETTDADEILRLQGDLLDLEPAVRDALVLAMPVTPLCRPDCPGLCAECGVPWDELPDDHRHETVDPRWAALDKLRIVDADGDDGRK
ncbi:YceD family protein [Glycomyces sp. L485]|uniref:YceD family protein n=1 Tax=Glycomyces sp. L485 TaxID=2909235 RepID=UPI001F4BA794|nr:YceD family protein [Glycomyces sp. L485]MCH7231458.1 YceD family protein [Glycomyces sp. L485]